MNTFYPLNGRNMNTFGVGLTEASYYDKNELTNEKYRNDKTAFYSFQKQCSDQ